ncbi:glycosyltransferase [Pandoraea horticolens]|uniref:Glycosyltransferase n=2 Tax=Pandoraea horticolens TaxID=2508298 RepID=A0A5E4WDP2_9BURK|nr:glycosyltransferase [Pandoraea horticolens]
MHGLSVEARMQKHDASVPDNPYLATYALASIERLARPMRAIARSPAFYVSIYAIVWTLVSASLDPTVPFDAVEAFNWARNAEWGTPKNPWLVGFSMWPVLGLDGEAMAIYWYASHFAAVAIGMLGVWHLAHRLSGERSLAWLAMLSLHLSGAINIDILPYNDNYLLVMLWPWMLWLFIRALLDSPRYWPAFAVVAGLAAMTKYSTFALLGAILVVILSAPQARRHYRHPAFLLGLGIFVALIAPNVVWLAHHDFAAFRWVDDQIKPRLNARALCGALTAFYPVAILALVMRVVGVRFRRPPIDARIVAGVLLLPLLPILLYFTLHNGGRISEWLQPFAVSLPAVLVACVQPGMAVRSWRIARWLPAAGLLVMAGYVVFLSANLRNAGQKFSGIKAASVTLEQRWQERYHMPLRYVGHDHVATWLTFYAPGNPRLLMQWSEARRPNIYTKDIDEADVRAHGAILLGPPGQSCPRASFTRTLAQWPTLVIDARETVPFSYHGGTSLIPLCVTYIAPQS